MIGRARARMNSFFGSISVRHYFRQSAGKGFYMMEEKAVRGKGRGFVFVGSYSLFMKNGTEYLQHLLLKRARTLNRRKSFYSTVGTVRLYGG